MAGTITDFNLLGENNSDSIVLSGFSEEAEHTLHNEEDWALLLVEDDTQDKLYTAAILMPEYGTFDSTDMDLMNDAIQRFKILILLCYSFSFCVMAQETESGLQKNTVNELNKAVETLVAQAKDPNRLIEFKSLRSLVSGPFNSTPLFLQTLESLKLAEERKTKYFLAFFQESHLPWEVELKVVD